MLETSPAHPHEIGVGSLQIRERGLDLPRHRADVPALDAGEDVDDPGDVHVVHFRRGRGALEGRDVPEENRLGLRVARDGDVLQGLERLDVLLAVLGPDEIMVAVFVVDPEGGIEVDARVQAGDHVLHDVCLGEAQVGRLDPVHFECDLRIVELLLDADVDGARHALYDLRDLERDVMGDLEPVSFDLDVDGRREPEVESGRHEAPGVERELEAGEALPQAPPEQRLVVLRGFRPVLGELEVQKSVHGPRVGRVGRGPVVEHADVGDEHLEVLGRNALPDHVFHLPDHLLRSLHPGPRGRPDADHELAGIDGGEELGSDEGVETERADENQGRDGEHGFLSGERARKESPVALSKGLEPRLERTPGRPAVFTSPVRQKARGAGGDEGHGEQVRRQKRERHAEGEGREEELSDAGEEHDGEEDGDDGDGDDQNRGRDLARSVEGGLERRAFPSRGAARRSPAPRSSDRSKGPRRGRGLPGSSC